MPYINRLNKLQETLKNSECDALIIEDTVNLFYMTGLELSSGKLIVHSQGADLLVDGRYFHSSKKHSPFPVLQCDPPTLETLLNSSHFSHINTLGFDSEKTSYKNYELLKKIIYNLNKHRNICLVPLDAPLKLQRSIKDPNEVQTLKKAAILGSQGFDYICSLLKEGITEQECAIELEIFWKKHGSKGLAFDPIIAFGSNSAMPHHRACQEKLKLGDAVLIDIGVNFKHYHSDMTRMVYFGKPNNELLAIHDVVQKAQEGALNSCKPGTTFGELDKIARNLIAKYGYSEQFTHSLGHGIGLNIHEYPTLRNTAPFAATQLEKGMVITIEPGIYLPNIGGVRIEDTVVITDNGHENLTLRNKAPLFI